MPSFLLKRRHRDQPQQASHETGAGPAEAAGETRSDRDAPATQSRDEGPERDRPTPEAGVFRSVQASSPTPSDRPARIFRSRPPVLTAAPQETTRETRPQEAPDKEATTAPDAPKQAQAQPPAADSDTNATPDRAAAGDAPDTAQDENGHRDQQRDEDRAKERDRARDHDDDLPHELKPDTSRPSPVLDMARASTRARMVRSVRPAPGHSPLPGPGDGYRVVPLPRLSQGAKWKTEALRSYPAPMLLWFTRGQGRLTLAGVTRGFGAHNAVFVPAGTMLSFELSGQVYGHALFFPDDTDLPLPEEPQHLRFRDAIEHGELTSLIDNIQREQDRGQPIMDRALAHYGGLLSVWLERQLIARAQREEPRANAARKLSAAYSALVEKDFRSGRSVAEYAADLGVTPTHLSRSCNAACGHSAHEILSDRIFFEARRLLRDTVDPVKDIAENLGFTSPAYFTRAFQRVTGETPTAFRRHV